jgi:hypothetical protein
MIKLNRSTIKMVLICTGIFLSGGVVAVAAVAIYGKSLNDAEHTEIIVDDNDMMDEELEQIIESYREEA